MAQIDIATFTYTQDDIQDINDDITRLEQGLEIWKPKREKLQSEIQDATLMLKTVQICIADAEERIRELNQHLMRLVHT